MFRAAVLALCCLGLFAAAGTPSHAASIPAWLDDAIANWNEQHADQAIRFVNVKDSFVWYDMPKLPELGRTGVRDRVSKIVVANGYVPMDEEELVTLGTPPAVSGPPTEKKCWKWSYVMNIQSQSNTKSLDEERAGQRQRMLTTLVCEDTSTWWAAFRVAD